MLLGGLLFTSTAGFADDIQNDAAFTCASAVNVLDCISRTRPGATKQAEITSVPLNSQTLGFTGPVSLGFRYDNYLAWIMDVGYAQSFYDTAVAFKLSAGLNERRANVTLGYSITPKQQIKLTYEYLAQNLPYDFASGKVNEWVNQHAFGAAYRYILDNGIVRALEVYGNYIQANSKELSDLEKSVDNNLADINQRRIAGTMQQNYGAAVTVTPFNGSLFKIGGGFSTLKLNTKWSDSQTQTAIVYNTDVSHLLTPTTLVSTGIGNTTAGRTYTGKVSKVLPWSLEGSLMGQYMATTNDIPGSASLTASLSYPAPKTYAGTFSKSIGDLKEWVQKPVIYNTRVLAKREQYQISTQMTTQPIPKQNIKIGRELTAISLQDYFIFNVQAFNKVDYQIISIAKTGSPTHTLPKSILNLAIEKNSNFQAKLISTAPITVSGDYIVTIQASGYRSGEIVSQVNNYLEISVSKDHG